MPEASAGTHDCRLVSSSIFFFATSCIAQTGGQTSGSANAGVSASTGQSSVQTEGNVNASAGVSAIRQSSNPNGQNGTSASSSSSGNANGSMNVPSAGDAAGSAGLAAGSTISAVLSKPVDAKKNKEGDPVMAKTTQNVKAAGDTIIPKGSRLLGHVTEVRSRAKGEANSELGIIFDQAVLKNGQQIPLHTVIQAIGSSQTSASSNGVGDTISDLGGASQAPRSTPANASGGLLGGVGSTVGGATNTLGAVGNTVGNVAGNATGSVNNTVGGTVNAVGAAGTLTSSSGGVFGLSGLSLTSMASNATQGSIITSPAHNVHLDSGTRLVLRVVQ